MFGFTQVPDGAGVFGAHATTGVGVAGLGLIGISGGSVNGVGVMGVSAPPGAKGGDGVQGITNSEFRNGVYGRNDSTTSRGNSDPAGNGIFGYSRCPDGAGILGAHGSTTGHGVIGTGGFGVVGAGSIIGVWGQGKGDGWAGYFSGPIRVDGGAAIGSNLDVTGNFTTAGNASVQGDLSVSGNFSASGSLQGPLTIVGDLSVTGDVILTNRDVAERFQGGGGWSRPARLRYGDRRRWNDRAVLPRLRQARHWSSVGRRLAETCDHPRGRDDCRNRPYCDDGNCLLRRRRVHRPHQGWRPTYDLWHAGPCDEGWRRRKEFWRSHRQGTRAPAEWMRLDTDRHRAPVAAACQTSGWV